MSYTTGETATVTYALTDQAGTPVAATVTATATRPDRTAVTLTVTPSGTVGTYTAPVALTQAGLWLVTFTASGAYTDTETVQLIADPALAPGGTLTGSYATPYDLAVFTRRATPPDAARQLIRATEVVDSALITAVYTTSPGTGLPSDAYITAALRDATCAQVEYWQAGDEDDDVLGPLDSLTVGPLSEQYGAGAARTSPTYLAPRAARILDLAGLLSAVVA